jgi:hypothetical protein
MILAAIGRFGVWRMWMMGPWMPHKRACNNSVTQQN